MSDLDTISEAKLQLALGTKIHVAAAITSLLGVPAPKGDSGAIDSVADAFGRASAPTDQIALDLANVTGSRLPEVMVGRTANKAADVTLALAEDIELGGAVFGKARTVLATLADGIADAKSTYDLARDPLLRAAAQLDDDYLAARDLGNSAADLLTSAITKAKTAGETAARELNGLAAKARSAALKTGSLSDTDRVLLAETAAPGGPQDMNIILTTSEAERAASRLNQLSEAERQRMTDLLANAKSPQERAYLLKTLAAGHNIDEVTKFGDLIHGHGDDPQWLREHLTPVVGTTGTLAATYKDGSYTQGAYPTCVASSTVMARAMIDPSYALMLTTGNKPDDPASTSKEAFLDRLRNEQATLYDHGREEGSVLGDIRQFFGEDGMRRDEGEIIADEQIGAITGQNYEPHEVDSPQSRRELLDDVYQAVDKGLPVPFQVSGDGGHQMLVIGREGDRLQIYNPWGITSWIDADAFINGRMNELDGQKVPPNVSGVLLPSK